MKSISRHNDNFELHLSNEHTQLNVAILSIVFAYVLMTEWVTVR